MNTIADIETAGTHVLTLTEGLEQEEFFRSRLTRQEARRQLLRMAQALSQLPMATRDAWHEVDWDAWTVTLQRLDHGDHENDALWFAIRSLVPATLMWLRVYQQPATTSGKHPASD